MINKILQVITTIKSLKNQIIHFYHELNILLKFYIQKLRQSSDEAGKI